MKKIQPGVFLCTKEEMIADQKGWGEEDGCKTMDFTQYEYWITTDDGITPIGFDSEEEAITSL